MRLALVLSAAIAMCAPVLLAADDPPEPNLLFHVSFNKRDVTADFARGNPESVTFEESLELRGVEGIDGPGFQIKEEERLDYNLKGNFDLRHGTISMWIKPINWMPDNGRFEHFFVAYKRGVFNFVVYKYTQPPDLRVHLVIGKRKFNAGATARAWRPGEWYKIDITWDSHLLRVYVNGKKEGELTFPDDLELPEQEEGTFTITPLMFWRAPYCSPEDRTIVDEVKIYDRPLTPGEVKDAYYTARNELEDEYRPPIVCIPVSESPVNLEDGFTHEEWKIAAQMPIAAAGGNGLASEQSAQFWAKYDKDNLYLAMRTMEAAPLTANATQRDGDMSKDDVYELTLVPPNGATYRFAVNGQGVLFDSKDGDATWNGDIKCRADGGENFVIECIIPFSSLGCDSPKTDEQWRANIARRWSQDGAVSSWAFVRTEDTDELGTIIFGGETSGARLTRLGLLNQGDIDIIARFYPPDDTSDRVQVLTRHFSDDGKLEGGYMDLDCAWPRPDMYRCRRTLEKPESGLIRVTAQSKTQQRLLFDYSILFYGRPPIAIHLTPIARTSEIEIALDTHDCGKVWHDRIRGGTVKCEVMMEEESAGQRIIEKALPIREVAARFTLPCPNLTPGQYKVSARLIDTESEDTAGSAVHITRPAAPWLDAKAGIDETVPTPWTPVKVNENSVRIWGREYAFERSPFPHKITSQGAPILTSPIALRVKTSAGKEMLEPKHFKLVESKATHAVFEGEARSTLLQVKWTSRIEFDGMLRCDFEIVPLKKPVQVEQLALDISLVNEHARFVLTPCLESWENNRIELGFTHLIWLTGHRLGLCWFTESDANWVNHADTKPILVSRDDKTATLTLGIITKPTKIETRIPYTMGIQATPAKALPQDWRNLNLGGHGKIMNARAQTLCWGGGGLKQNAYLQAADDDAFRKILKKWNDMKMAGCPYSCPTYMASHNPIYNFYHSEWRNSEGHKYVGYVKDTLKYDLVAMCPRSAYTDLLAWWVDDMARRFDIGGIYFDCCSPDVCHNQYHGCGGRDKFGKRIQMAPIFPLRESLKRVYRILHRRNMILINHSHSRFLPPCHSFSDYWYPGEQYTVKLGQNIYFYTDELTPEIWQSELNSYIKGVGISFLPEYGRGTPTKYRDEMTKPSRSLLACCIVNDVPCSASWINLGEIEKVWKIFDKFWVSDAEFIPYWRPGPVTAAKPLTVSAYKSKKSLLLMISNLTKEAASGTVKVDAKALGIPDNCKITNECDGKIIKQPLDAIKVKLPDRDYTMISVTW